MKKQVCIVMVAHNQFSLVVQQMKNIQMFVRDLESIHVVVVDNDSNDGLSDWLFTQQNIDYIICNQGRESYAAILNTVIREFVKEEDILLLSPHMLLMPETIERMQNMAYEEVKTGAVNASSKGVNISLEMDFSAAIDVLYQHMVSNKKQTFCIHTDATYLKCEFITDVGEFDEEIIVPYNSFLDYSFRGITQSWQYYDIDNAFLYKIGNGNSVFTSGEEEADWEILQRKWGMNYFNQAANGPLISYIEKEDTAQFNVLEIGCDCGVNLLEIHNRFPNARLYGVEINSQAAQIAKNIADVQVGNIEDKNLDFHNIKFDYIIFGDVLEHLRNPEKTLRYCKTLLSTQGRVLACIPNLLHYSVISRLLEGYFTYTDRGLLDRTHIHLFTRKEIEKMFVNEGYCIEKMDFLTIKEDLSVQEENMIETLVNLSKEGNREMYEAFQYIVSARYL